MIDLTLDLAGSPSVAGQLDRAKRLVTDLSEFYRGAAENAFTAYQTRVFATQGGENGVRWPDNHPLVKRMKQRTGRGRGGVGRDTNRMWASLTKRFGPDSLAQITPTTFTRGTSVFYARYFNDGTKGGKLPKEKTGLSRDVPWRLPARPLIVDPLPQSFVLDLQTRFDAYLARRLAASA